ncbi:MAG: NAD(P)-dependent oxidoreductase, partial [Bacteroidetes bacterium]|nr:NAD(P)-dependent oxidoreductase [Bacteroidota bacterium]
MIAFITGATGFIGSHITDVLLSHGFRVRCGFREHSNLQWLKDKPVELVKYSLFDEKSLSDALKEVDYIIHCGGTIMAKKPSVFFHVNRDGTINLLKSALEQTPNLKRFVYISSQTVGGPAKALTEPISEFDQPNPVTNYAKSKKEAEDHVLEYGKYFPVTILRPSAVVGPRDPAIFTIFKSIKNRIVILIGMKKKYLNIIHAVDLAEATYNAAISDNTIGKIYYIADEMPVSWNEIMSIGKRELNRNFTLNIHFPHFFVLGAAYSFEQFRRIIGKPHPFNLDKGRDFIQKYWTCSVDCARST